MLRVERILNANWEEALREPWRELWASSPTSTPFQSWEWVSAWSRTLGRSKRPYLLGAYEGDDLVGLMPLTLTSLPWRTVRWMGAGVSDYLEPLARPGMAARIGAEFLEFLIRQREVDLIDLHQIRGHQPFGETASVRAMNAQSDCPVLTLPATFDSYASGLSKSLRYDIKKGLERGGLELAQTVEEAMDAWRHFLALHAQRWRKRGLPGAFGLVRIQRFHEAWIPAAIATNQLRFWTLQHDGHVVGALYCMRAGHSTYFYQSGFAPEAKAVSPGTTLISAAIRHAIEEGCAEFDFLRGAEPYKMRWKPQVVHSNGRLMIQKATLRGEIGLGVNAWEAKVEAKLRARLEGRGLLG